LIAQKGPYYYFRKVELFFFSLIGNILKTKLTPIAAIVPKRKSKSPEYRKDFTNSSAVPILTTANTKPTI
jgi:hypothetical protein